MKKYILWILTFGWAVLIWRLTTTPQIIITESGLLQTLLMMFSHFVFFGIQATLLKSSLSTIQATALTSFYGALIEYVQLTVPGRSSDPLDWVLDTLGAIVFLAIIKKYENLNHRWSWLYRGDHS